MAALKGDDHVNDFCSVTISGCKADSDCGWCKKVWNAAIEHAEEKFTSTNNARAETVRACSECKVSNRTIEACFFCFLEKYQRTASPVA